MNYRNAKHISEGRIDCEIEHPVHGWIPYTLDPADTDMTVDNDALLLAIGDDAEAYVEPTQEELDAELSVEMREQRDSLLLVLDAMVSNPIRWAGFSGAQQTAMADYRQELLDVPQQAGFPNTVVWPTEPY
mgnify:CR=1 FL=1